MVRQRFRLTFFACLLVSATTFARPVVVGIPDVCFTNTLVGVRVDYADAVYAAGAVPYVLPETTNGLVIAALLDRVDMLLLCGGGNVDPARSDERPAPRQGTVNARRDAWECRLQDEATRRRLPILGVCRDCQSGGVQFNPESMFADHGVKDSRPLFRGGIAEFVGKVEKRVSPSTKKLVAIPDYCATNRYVVMKTNMAAALEQAGFVSVVVPFTEDDVQLEAAMADADALMVAGGIGDLQDYWRRCAFEQRMIALALKRGIPICGVCHGSQVINVHFGGTLEVTPQKADETNFLIAHRMPVTVPYVDNFHLADLVPGSRIATVLGSTRAVINSSHSRRSFEMGKGLRVTARAPDGVVEAFEHETLPVMAFQFHPERMTYDRRFVELLRVALSD